MVWRLQAINPAVVNSYVFSIVWARHWFYHGFTMEEINLSYVLLNFYRLTTRFLEIELIEIA